MPKEIEERLKKGAKKRGLMRKGKLTKGGRAYVYGTMREIEDRSIDHRPRD